MKSISYQEARELLLNCDAKYVSGQQYQIYYDDFSGNFELSPYLSNGCVVVKNDIDWHIHALSSKSDIFAAIEDTKQIADLTKEKIMVLTWKEIPQSLLALNNYGSFIFTQSYKPYEDHQIRPITLSDSKQILACCSPDLDDTKLGQRIAKQYSDSFMKYLEEESDTIFLGIFEKETLLGFVQADPYKNMKLAGIDIFVNRTYRHMGYAKRLLSAICATSNDLMYSYSCARTNTASIATAKSAGFILMGAYLYIC